MGFQPKPTIYRLTFEAPELEGLVVRARAPRISEALEHARRTDFTGLTPAEAEAKVADYYAQFAAVLISWNVVDEHGDPVPPTVEGLLSQEQEFVETLINAWVQSRASVPAPLERSSPGGGPSLEASMPMEPLSESLAS